MSKDFLVSLAEREELLWLLMYVHTLWGRACAEMKLTAFLNEKH